MSQDLYTPAEIAEKLKLYKDGKPHTEFVRRLIRKGKLEYIKISKNNIRITQHEYEAYIRRITCRAETKGFTLPTEKTEVGGVSLNTEVVKDIGTLAATNAEKMLKMRLSNSLSNKEKEQETPQSILWGK